MALALSESLMDSPPPKVSSVSSSEGNKKRKLEARDSPEGEDDGLQSESEERADSNNDCKSTAVKLASLKPAFSGTQSISPLLNDDRSARQ